MRGARADGEYAAKDGRPFHVRCYRDRFHPRCSVCFELIPFEGQDSYSYSSRSCGGVRWWISHPYWCDATYYPKHERDGTKKCDGCGGWNRKRGVGGRAFAALPDGQLCLECASAAVVDADRDSTPVYDSVCQFMAELGLPLVKGGVEGVANAYDERARAEEG